MTTRRDFLKTASALAVTPSLCKAAPSQQATVAKDNATVTLFGDMPTTGHLLPSMRAFDEMIVAHLREKDLPGGSVAVMRAGRLVYTRGYGYADREARTPVEPASLFRLASVSKPITGTAIMTLMQSPKYHLNLDTRVFRLLGLQPFLKPGKTADPRIWDITLRHLLHHAGGWDRGTSGDIMFKHFQIAREMGIDSPPDHTSLIRWAMGQPLDFVPGEREAYSNFGYCVLGRVIEKVSGLSYETYVRDQILAPAGITTMRIGKGHRSERLPDEVVYYTPGDRMVRSVFSKDGSKPVPAAYGFNSPETMDAHGGWIASAIDLMRFAAALDGTAKTQLLAPDSLKQMYARPAPPLGVNADGTPSDVYYALGWSVRPTNTGANYWHMGGMPGASTVFVRLSTGLSWALLVNRDDAGDLDRLMHRAAGTVRTWPLQDLFGVYR